MEREKVVQVGKNEAVCSYGVGAVRITTIVDWMQHHITFQDVMHAPETIYNLSFIPQALKNRFIERVYDNPSYKMRG